MGSVQLHRPMNFHKYLIDNMATTPKKCVCYLADLLDSGYPCEQTIPLSVDFQECIYNNPLNGQPIDPSCPQYLFDIGMYYVNTNAFPNTRAWIYPICLPGRVITRDDVIYWGLLFQDLDDPNIYRYSLSCLPQLDAYNNCGECECCCGCC